MGGREKGIGYAYSNEIQKLGAGVSKAEREPKSSTNGHFLEETGQVLKCLTTVTKEMQRSRQGCTTHSYTDRLKPS